VNLAYAMGNQAAGSAREPDYAFLPHSALVVSISAIRRSRKERRPQELHGKLKKGDRVDSGWLYVKRAY